MSTKLKPPAITMEQFDGIELELRAALRKWWMNESESFDAAVAGTASVWDGMPEIDSKVVVKASPVIREFTGTDLDPKLIRKGGYSSFDDLAADLLPKLRATCLTAPSASRTSIATTMESINVRRS